MNDDLNLRQVADQISEIFELISPPPPIADDNNDDEEEA